MGKCASLNKESKNCNEILKETPQKLDRKLSYGLERQPTIRPSIKARVVEEAKSATIITEPSDHKETKELMEILKAHFLFSIMPEETLKYIIKRMKSYLLEENEIVYLQGNIGVNFFIVIKGKLEETIDGDSVSVIGPKSCFGELGLIQDKERSSTIVTLERTVLKGIDRSSYKKATSSFNEKKHEENLSFIESVQIFKGLNKQQLQRLLQIIVTQKFSNGEKIITEGETGDLFYIIKEGTVHCTKKGVLLKDFSAGEYFGEQALLYKSKRKATITAAGKVLVISIGREDLILALGQRLEKVVYRNTISISFSKNPYAKNLNQGQIANIIEKLEVKSFSPNEILETAGSIKGNTLYIVLKGALVTSNNKFRLYDFIGDEELALENSKRVFKTDLVAEEDSDVALISKKTFENCIGGDLKTVLAKNHLIEVLKNVTLLAILPISKLQMIINVLTIQEFSAGEVIFSQHSQGDKFYIVKEGVAEILKDGVSIRTVETNGFFGERAILLDESRNATIKASTSLKC